MVLAAAVPGAEGASPYGLSDGGAGEDMATLFKVCIVNKLRCMIGTYLGIVRDKDA